MQLFPLKRRVLSLALACAVVLASVSVALAASDPIQKAGTAGCLSETGSGGSCLDGRGLGGAASVAISPDGQYAYVASSGGDGIAILNRNLANGTLSQVAGTAGCFSVSGSGGECQKGRELDAADDVAVSPDEKSVYVAAPEDDAIAVFGRSLATGELNQLVGADGCVIPIEFEGCDVGWALDGATSVVVGPNGNQVYVASAGTSGGIAIFDRAASGALTQKAGTAGCINEGGAEGCADGNEQTLGVQNLEISPDGKAVYAVSQTRNAITVYDRDLTTGELTQKAGSAGCINEEGTGGCQNGTALLLAGSLAISPDGENVYVASKLSDAIAIFDRNTANNELTQKVGTAGCVSESGTGGACQKGNALDEATSVAVLPDGEAVYAASRGSNALAIFTRDPGSGALAQKPGTAGCIAVAGASGCQVGRGLLFANHVAIAADGENVYTAAIGASAIAVFDIGTLPSPPEEPPVVPPVTPPVTETQPTPSPAVQPRLIKGKGPKAIMKTSKSKVSVSFRFSSDLATATFQCKLDRGAFKSCKSPASATVKPGRHTFTVQALSAGQRSAPASFSFTVKKTPPKA